MSKRKYFATGSAIVLTLGSAGAWTPGSYPAPSRDFTVDRFQRNDVLSFWNGVYQASEGFQSRMKWTGSYTTGTGAEGTNSTEFIADMERRLNYFRAMSGVPANARMNTPSTVVIQSGDTYKPDPSTQKTAAVQRAALMITMNQPSSGFNPAFTHTPPVTTTWTAVPWNANNKGNIGLNIFGPNAITAYMREADNNGLGSENKDAGHRRWLVRGASTHFATGDIPGFFDPIVGASSFRPAANVIYVIQNPSENAPVAPAFVSYPPSGFFPAPLNAKFWSLSYPGASFGSAAVTVTQVGGSSVPSTVNSTNFAAGDPGIVWEVPTEHAATSFSEDRTYNVTVSGITGAGVPNSYSYQVTFINPNALTSDQTLTGTAVPHPPTPAKYTFTPPPFAEALRVNTYREIPVSWTETAEVGTASTVIDRTSGTYTFLSATTFPTSPAIGPITGARSFRPTHATAQSPVDQIFELGRQIMPNPGATLTFKYRRGFMATPSKLVVEASSDRGITWAQIGSTISGTNTNNVDATVSNGSALLASSSTPVVVRFRYFVTPGGIFTHDLFPTQPTGIFIDTITLNNANWLEPRKTNELAADASSFTLDTTTQGGPMQVGEQWHLTLQTKLGNRWFPDGPLKSIIPSATPPLTPYELWVAENPGLVGGFNNDEDDDGVPNGVEFAFFLNPKSPTPLKTEVIMEAGGSDFSIQTPLAAPRDGAIYEAECSESLAGGWTSANVSVSISGGVITATAPRHPSGRCFIRWKISLP